MELFLLFVGNFFLSAKYPLYFHAICSKMPLFTPFYLTKNAAFYDVFPHVNEPFLLFWIASKFKVSVTDQ